MSVKDRVKKIKHIARAGLPESSATLEEALRETGIDPDRLSIFKLGQRQHLLVSAVAPWLKRMFIGLGLWLLVVVIEFSGFHFAEFLQAAFALIIGLIILQAACEALITATERLAARLHWNHYAAGTVAEILSTAPELVVIAFIVPVSPTMAFLLTLITIYNNALVFSVYSFFLPKDKRGKFLMPAPITEVGTQILIGGGAMGLILGLVMLTFNSEPQAKSSFAPVDLLFISLILGAIFLCYLYKLVTSYAEEEAEVRENLGMSQDDIEQRLNLVYENVDKSSFGVIAGLFLIGLFGAVIGGEQVSEFASTMIKDLEINNILTALILAIFAGMSEYVILWKSHRKQEYGIALANAFGGITQVMFLVLPFTLVCIAGYQLLIDPEHVDLPIQFSITNIFLLIFLFPTFYTLSSLLEEDHTLGILDTVIMVGIFLFLIVLLVSYGSVSG
ncbi:MAG: hypothetical protein HQ498_03710 [Pseudohongiella sp.]|jgi:hypothetical protein|nr:hypothetical protein [Pseudohongiella sp.]